MTTDNNEDIPKAANAAEHAIIIPPQLQEEHGPAIAAMQEKFPNANVSELLRFLQARKWNASKAMAMYEAHLEWRSTTLPKFEEPDVQAQIQRTIATKKWYLLEHTDQDGRPVVVYCFRRFMELGYDTDEELQAFFWWMEHRVIPKTNAAKDGKMVCLIDVSGIRSPPLSFLRAANAIFEAHYPERLHRSILCPVPGWVQTIIRGMLGFVDPTTREKFVFSNDTQSLLEWSHMETIEHMGPDVAALVASGQLRST